MGSKAAVQRLSAQGRLMADFVEKLGIGPKQHRQPQLQEKILLPYCSGCAAIVASYLW